MRTPAALALLLALAAPPAAAQQPAGRADACKRDAARFADTILDGTDAAAAGTRQGARLGEDERRRMRDLVGEARAAADGGDVDGCLQRLREARTLARETGFGSGQPNPGGATGAQGGAGSGTSGSGGGAGSLTPTPQIPGATPGAGAGGRAGSGGSMGGGTGGSGSGSR